MKNEGPQGCKSLFKKKNFKLTELQYSNQNISIHNLPALHVGNFVERQTWVDILRVFKNFKFYPNLEP